MKPKKPEIYILHIVKEGQAAFDNFLINKIITKYAMDIEDLLRASNAAKTCILASSI